MPIDPHKLDDPRIQKGLEAIARRLEKRALKGEKELPYANERAALEVKAWLDELHLKQEPIRILGSTSTIRLKYYQGSRYLYTHIDAGYEEIVQRTKCTTTRKYIELSIREHRLKRGEHVVGSTFNKDDFIQYLNSSIKGDKFYRETVLTLEEINWINDLLAPLGNLFVSSVTEKEIKVIRVE